MTSLAKLSFPFFFCGSFLDFLTVISVDLVRIRIFPDPAKKKLLTLLRNTQSKTSASTDRSHEKFHNFTQIQGYSQNNAIVLGDRLSQVVYQWPSLRIVHLKYLWRILNQCIAKLKYLWCLLNLKFSASVIHEDQMCRKLINSYLASVIKFQGWFGSSRSIYKKIEPNFYLLFKTGHLHPAGNLYLMGRWSFSMLLPRNSLLAFSGYFLVGLTSSL